MDSYDDSPEEQLFQYWRGWESGVSGSETTKEDRQNMHFRNGHADGCTLRRCAYESAYSHYNATLNPLREANP